MIKIAELFKNIEEGSIRKICSFVSTNEFCGCTPCGECPFYSELNFKKCIEEELKES